MDIVSMNQSTSNRWNSRHDTMNINMKSIWSSIKYAGKIPKQRKNMLV